jgi:hypothetical protein
MLRVKRFVGAVLTCWVVMGAASLATAQERRVEVREREGRASKPLRAKDVLGAKVSIRGDVSVGTVDDIVFDRDGYIDYLLVLKDGKYVVVPWGAAKFNAESRAATVDITQEKFREIPTYTQERWPNFYDQTFRTQVYGYYGLKPGQERRIERREGIRRR